jgi:hypothetical protein
LSRLKPARLRRTQKTLVRLKVIRPYGRIGPLEWQGDGGIPFGGTDESLYEAVTAMSNIRTFTDQIEGSPVLGDINKPLEDAQLLVILGFGFHQQNMQLFTAGYDDHWLAPHRPAARHSV